MSESEATKIAVAQSTIEAIQNKDLPRIERAVQDVGSKFDKWTDSKDREIAELYLTKEEFKPYKRILGLLATIAVTTLAIAILNLAINQRQRVDTPSSIKQSPAAGAAGTTAASGGVPAGGQPAGAGGSVSDDAAQVTTTPTDTGLFAGTPLSVPDATRFLGLLVGKVF